MILPRGPWGTIVADPPWPYNIEGPRATKEHRPNTWDGTSGGASSERRYGAMAMDELLAMPVRRIGARNAHLYLWTTNSFMEEAHVLAKAWGFQPKTILTWVKVRNGMPCEPSMRTGFYFRGATEHALFCVRGSLRLQTSRCLPTAYLWPRLRHSVKPDSFYGIVEEASPGPYLELFARRPREGWTLWGNQAPQPMEATP